MVQTGKALDLYRAPKDILAARTFSDLNEIPARIEQGIAATALGRFPANGVAEGADAIVCVRQRGVRLLATGRRRAGPRARCALPRRRGAGGDRGAGPRNAALARVKESDTPPQGSEMGVGIDAGAVLVFEAEEPAAADAAGRGNGRAARLASAARFAAIVPAG